MTEPEQLEGTQGTRQDEPQVTRRKFLQGGLAVAGSMAVAPSLLRSPPHADRTVSSLRRTQP